MSAFEGIITEDEYYQDIDGDWVKKGKVYCDPFTGKDIDGDYVGEHGGCCN